MSPVGPLMRDRLDRHLTQKLAPRARRRARALRKALYASWSYADLHAEATRIVDADAGATGAHHHFLQLLIEDVAAQMEARKAPERRTA